VPARLEQNRLNTVSLLILAATAAGFALHWMRPVLVPFVLAVMISYMVAPLVDGLQERLRAPRWAALLAAFITIAGVLGLISILLFTSIGGLVENVDLYKERTVALVERLFAVAASFGFDFHKKEDMLRALRNIPLMSLLKNTAGGLLQTLTTTILVQVFAVYLILGHKAGEKRGGVWGEMDGKIRRYLMTKVATSVLAGVVVGLVLWAFGLELALLFGFCAFLLNFIPSVGSIVATLLPLPMALVQFDSGLAVFAVIAIPGIFQLVVGNGIEPRLMGEGLDLHPLTILLALIFWGLIWGIVGMLLAAPITAILKIILARFETTNPMAELLAGRLPEWETEAEG
jgi:AI-2 transport protein TqsA